MLNANCGRSELFALARNRETRASVEILGCRIIGIIVLLFCLSVGQEAFAQSAKEQLQGTLSRVIDVLKTIQGRDDIARHKAFFRELLARRFDFAAMAQHSLSDHWNELDGREDQFVSLFTDFLEAMYMGTLGSYQGEQIIYDAERVNRELAEVDTRVVGGRGAPIEVKYKLHLKQGAWKVFDVVIDDVSIISNYRSQFLRILRTNSLQDLIGKLRAKASQSQ